MPWYAYIRNTDGALLSLAQAASDPPPDVTRTLLAVDPTDPAWMYDPATRAFVARPAKVLIDRLQDMLDNPAYADFVTVWQGLNATRKNQLRTMLIRLLGRQRYRAQSEEVEL